MTSLINFPCKVCGKNVIMNASVYHHQAIQCELCNYWFTLIAITLIILTINSFKIPMILGIVSSVAVRFSHLILWNVIKIFPCVWLSNFHNNNNSGKTTTELSNFFFLLQCLSYQSYNYCGAFRKFKTSWINLTIMLLRQSQKPLHSQVFTWHKFWNLAFARLRDCWPLHSQG